MNTQEGKEKRVALVTGASRGIGAAALNALGASCVVHGTATGEDGVAKINDAIASSGFEGSGHLYRAGDDGHLKALTESLPKVDILVCNAGMNKDGIFMRMRDEDFSDVIEANLAAPFKLARHYVRNMVKARWGRIIMVTSVVASTGNVGQANYVASKAGLEGLAKTLAQEYGGKGVTVNSVAPGLIDTDMTREKMNEQVKEALVNNIPLNRAGTPEEVAAAIAFLASDEAGYITGATIAVNGGLSMG